MRLPAPALAILVVLTGCGAWPDPTIPGDASARAAPWPVLQPLGTLGADRRAGAAPMLPPAARAAALRARAAALRGPVVDRATRARLAGGVDVSALQGVR